VKNSDNLNAKILSKRNSDEINGMENIESSDLL
jgi:hypothetical protein